MNERFRTWTVENSVRIAGFYDVREFRKVISNVHVLADIRKYQDITLDFSDLTFTQSAAMLPIISECLRRSPDQSEFTVILPKEERLARLFVNSNWAHLIDPNYAPSTYNPAKHNPTRRFRGFDEQALLVNEVIDTMLANFTGFSRSHLKAIEWSLNEITDNVLVHSNSSLGGLIQVCAIKSKQRVEFVTVDSGVGIASSLRNSNTDISSDVDALSRAIQEGVTRDKAVGQGNGLFGTYRISTASSGLFSIHSNRATLYYSNKTGMHSRSEAVPFHGSMVVCGIDYSNELLLDEALRFDGRPHRPIDRVALNYEDTEQEAVLFNILMETTSVGSRLAGRPVRTKLLNLIKMCGGQKIVVDFDGIKLISSSFADEVFGKIFIEIGPIAFASALQMVNMEGIVGKLIDKAIMQRMSVGVTD